MVKKVLPWSLIVIVAGMGILWVLGERTYSYSTTTTIAAPPERVWASLTEKDKLLLWIEGLKSSTPVATDGLRVGAKSVETIEKNGQLFNMESEIVRLEPPRAMEIRFVMAGAGIVEARYELTTNGSRTRVSLKEDEQSQGWFRLFAPFIGAEIQGQLDRDIVKWKDVVEKDK